MKIKQMGNNYCPVLKANKKGYVTCPFCQQKHKHGVGDGHRVADCGSRPTINPIVDDVQLFKDNGYFIEY